MSSDLVKGQQVRSFFNRWTPDGWEPVVQLATVVDPCVENDPDYAGKVRISVDGALLDDFVDRVHLEPVEVLTPAFTPGRYLRICRERVGKSIEDVAAQLGTEPRVAEHARVDQLRLIEADEQPASFETIVALCSVYDLNIDVLAQLVAITMGSPLPPPAICRKCGCDDDRACDGGCSWVEEDLCSSCAEEAEQPAPSAPSPTATGEVA